MKRCLDCAEYVRAEARKCRYCGYRFDVRKSAPSPNWLSSLSGPFKRQHNAETPVGLLAGWGVELPPDESVRFWLLGLVSAGHGYLVVTDRRFMFFQRQGVGAKTYEKLYEGSLRSISTVEAVPGRGRRLRLAGSGYDLTVSGLKGAAPWEVCEFVRPLIHAGESR